jgi:hypothetical protein
VHALAVTGKDGRVPARESQPDIPIGERSAGELDDRLDREELRTRYYGLLQELRVVLPGTQMLVAFLLTIPFNNRFTELDEFGRILYGVALVAGTLAIVFLIGPTAFHRIGPRQSRSRRLQWSIVLTRLGIALLGVSLVTALGLVTRLVFGGFTALLVTGIVAVVTVGTWAVLPRVGAPPRDDPQP